MTEPTVHVDDCGCQPFNPEASSPIYMAAFSDQRCIDLTKKKMKQRKSDD